MKNWLTETLGKQKSAPGRTRGRCHHARIWTPTMGMPKTPQ